MGTTHLDLDEENHFDLEMGEEQAETFKNPGPTKCYQQILLIAAVRRMRVEAPSPLQQYGSPNKSVLLK